MDLVIVSGRSGSGKSTALHQLEDEGFFAIDNLPVTLLPALVEDTAGDLPPEFRGIAVCIDARAAWRGLRDFEAILARLPDHVRHRVVYLDADEDSLIRRFSETRRRHPLTSDRRSLAEAIRGEAELLEPLASAAALTLDTRSLTIYELRDAIRQRLVGQGAEDMALLLQSFGFKRGLPSDADLVFDLRMLPNPHWSEDLRSKTGLDTDVATYLESHAITNDLFEHISGFVDHWLPSYEASSRSYLTVALGCTGGQHRSVYMAHRLYRHLRPRYAQVQLRHRELQ